MKSGTAGVLPVSAIVPAFNGAATVGRALRSISGQPAGFRPAETIVVDDHSSDDTAAVAARFGAKVIRHESNRGAAAARNTAIAAATQPWVALLDADDEWLSNRLSALWPLRGAHVLVGGACVSVFDNSPDRIPEYAGIDSREAQVLLSPARLIPLNVIPASATIALRDVVLKVGGYDTSLKYAEDWDLWLRVLELGSGLLTPEVVMLYHRHGSQKSQHESGPAETHRQIVEKCRGRPWWTAELSERWDGVRGVNALKEAIRAGDALRGMRVASALLRNSGQRRAVSVRRRQNLIWGSHTERLARERDQRLHTPLNAALDELWNS